MKMNISAWVGRYLPERIAQLSPAAKCLMFAIYRRDVFANKVMFSADFCYRNKKIGLKS